MSDSVIPDAANEPEPSPAVVALRKEIGILQNVVYVMGNAPIKAKEADQAVEILKYLDGLADAKIKALDSLIATEMLGRPMQMDGTKLSLAPEAH